MKKYILNANVKYREEDGYILICDCMRLIDYEMPMDTLLLLHSLKKGVSKENISKRDWLIVKEMYDLGLVIDNKVGQKQYREDTLGRLTYKESEFF